MEKVHKKVKNGEEEKDYHYWLTRSMDERFDHVADLLELYFEMHPGFPQRIQKVYRLLDKQGNVLKDIRQEGCRDSA